MAIGNLILWDTNTVIYFLQGQLPENAEKYIDESLKNLVPAISVITEIELLCWKTASKKDLEVIHNFISDAIIIEIEQRIKMKTAEIRKSFNLKLPDAVIAATAMEYNITLLTRNVKDFKAIKKLKIINPFQQ